jgi:hypothetical protein
MATTTNNGTIAFVVKPEAVPALEIRVNIGVFASRQATPAEIDRLAERLLGGLESVTIVAEERHEIGHGVEASVHQVRIELADDQLPAGAFERLVFERTLLAEIESWARACIDDRHVEPAG